MRRRRLLLCGVATLAGAARGGQLVVLVEVVIQNYRFEPPEVRIAAGTTVKWVNAEKRTSHSVVFPPEQGGESERFFPGESWQRVFDTPGRFAYQCGPHPEMKGVVIVEGASSKH